MLPCGYDSKGQRCGHFGGISLQNDNYAEAGCGSLVGTFIVTMEGEAAMCHSGEETCRNRDRTSNDQTSKDRTSKN